MTMFIYLSPIVHHAIVCYLYRLSSVTGFLCYVFTKKLRHTLTLCGFQ